MKFLFVRISALLLLALSATAASAQTLLIVGDSISAAYGMKLEAGWVNLLREMMAQESFPLEVVNASISGDTSRSGASRLPKALALHQPAIVILELGGNDGLRGLPLGELRSNLEHMIEASQAANAKVLLLGMRIPPNYGPHYTKKFHEIYASLAQKYDTALVPFVLDAVAAKPGLTQKDGIHPTAEAQPLILKTVWPALLPLLETPGKPTQ